MPFAFLYFYRLRIHLLLMKLLFRFSGRTGETIFKLKFDIFDIWAIKKRFLNLLCQHTLKSTVDKRTV